MGERGREEIRRNKRNERMRWKTTQDRAKGT